METAVYFVVAEAIAKSRYSAWNPHSRLTTWDEFTDDPAHSAEVAVYREDGARDATQVLADLTDSTTLLVSILPADFLQDLS